MIPFKTWEGPDEPWCNRCCGFVTFFECVVWADTSENCYPPPTEAMKADRLRAMRLVGEGAYRPRLLWLLERGRGYSQPAPNGTVRYPG